MNLKRAASLGTIIILVVCVCAVAYIPVIKLLSRTITTERPLFSNEQYMKEGFRLWEIAHLDEKDKHGWNSVVDGDRNVVVLFAPAKISEFKFDYSIQPPRAGETTLRVWLNKELTHEILVNDGRLYLICGTSLLDVAAPDGLGNALLAAKGDANNLDFSVGVFLAARDEWSSVAAIVNAKELGGENETIPNNGDDDR